MRAVYLYTKFGYGRGDTPLAVNCDILGETRSSYKIKLLAPNVRGRRYGDIIWVRKKHVRIPKDDMDMSNEWYQNL